MWIIIKQKIFDKLTIYDIKTITIKNIKIINTKIANNFSLYDRSITKRILNIKIANKLFAYLFKINFTFIAELKRINNDLNNKINIKLNSKLITKIKNFKAYNTSYTFEVQNLFNDQ
jgi:hypothetical protein